MSDAVSRTARAARGGEHMATRRRPSRALVAAAACGPLAILLPLGFTLYRAATFGIDDAIELLWRPLVGELLVNTLSILSPYGPEEKQCLLEAPDLRSRAEALVALAEMELATRDDGSGTSLQ